MKRWIKWFALFSLLAPFLVCDPYQTSVGITHFLVQLDGGSWTASAPVIDATGTYLHYDLGPLAVGNHVIKAKAVNSWGESGESNPFSFNKVLPVVPGGLKLSTN